MPQPDAVPDKKDVSPDLLRGRCRACLPVPNCIERVHIAFKIRFIQFTLPELSSNVQI